jgi:hypothetical protein
MKLSAGSFLLFLLFFNITYSHYLQQIPVELQLFTASLSGLSVQLDWSTASEVNNAGFGIERKIQGSGFVTVGFVAGSGTTNEQKLYSFTDKPANQTQTLIYRLKQLDFDGTFTYSHVISVDFYGIISGVKDTGIPAEFSLHQNFPNPFNPSTVIKFGLPFSSNVSLKVYNILGKEVAVLFNSFMEAGIHETSFNAAGFPGGVYLYEIRTDAFTSVRKMVVLK